MKHTDFENMVLRKILTIRENEYRFDEKILVLNSNVFHSHIEYMKSEK